MTTSTASIVSLPSTETYFLTPDGIIVTASLSSTGTGAAVWQNGILSYTEPFPAGDGFGYIGGISDTGSVVASTTTNSTSYSVSHGVIWENGAPVSLGSLGSGFTTASAVNDSGEVVGSSYVTGTDQRAFMWQDGVMTALASLAGTAAPGGSASALNNAGQIVGQSQFLTATGVLLDRATLWQNGQPTDLGALPDGSGNSYAVAINNEGQAIGEVLPTVPSNSVQQQQAALFQNGTVTLLAALAANEPTVATAINDAGTVVGWAETATGAEHAVMWQNGAVTDLNSLLPANSGWVLQEADGVDAKGEIYGGGTLNGVAAVFLLTPGGASSSAAIDASTPNLTVNGTASVPTTVDFSGTASEYSISVSGGSVIITDTGTGRTSTDHLTNITAIHFSDVTDIVAATPGPASAVTGGNITELYGAVFGRVPDVSGLVFYQNYLTANPSTPLLQFAEWFLSSTEYTSAHTYAQSSAGDTQFITDSYQNLLSRAPSASEVSFYETKVLAPAVANLTPGTAAYEAAQLQAHAQMLVYFSASTEFLGDVQVTAQAPSSAHHWLILT